MPNVFKQPQYKRTEGSVKIPEASFSALYASEAAQEPEEDFIEQEPKPEEEVVRPRFEPVIPTREELMERFQDELSELRREAAQQGYADALKAKRGELQQCMDQVEALLTGLERSQREFMEQYAGELQFLAVDIAETILRSKIEADDLALKELVMQAVSRTRNAEWLDVEISEQLAGLVNYLKEEFHKPEYRGRVSVSPKPLPADTVRVHTQLGTTDASVLGQVERLREIFETED